MLKTLYRFLSPRFQNVFLDYKVEFKPRSGHGHGPAPDRLKEIVEKDAQQIETIISAILERKEIFQTIKKETEEKDENLPSWNNGFLPGLDIVALYTIIQKFAPSKYIEIGSGNSTKVVRKAIEDGNLSCEITSIDPFPRASIDHLADTVIRKPLEEIEDLSPILNLKKGDVLFIDNSHRCLPNSDVTVCFLEILPHLEPGVIVHIHDIYLPYDYPQFMCDRAYSEQYVLAAMLLANPDRYKTLFPNYFVSEESSYSKKLEGLWEHNNLADVERHGGSFWLQIGS